MINLNDLEGYIDDQYPSSLHQAFGIIGSKQVSTFRQLGAKCTVVQQMIESVQKSMVRLQEKQRIIFQQVQFKKIRELRDKQNSFLISSLQEKIKRLNENQEDMQSEIEINKRKCIELQLQLEDQKLKNSQLVEELQQRKKQIREVMRINTKIKNQKNENKSQEKVQVEALPTFGSVSTNMQIQCGINNQEYQILERKLKQLEDQFNSEIEAEKAKNNRLQQKIKSLHAEIQEQSGSKEKVYKLELKLANVTNQYKELQHSFSQILNKNNQYQISLHKKALQYKEIVQKQKKELKKYKLQVDGLLKNLVADVLGEKDLSTFFIGVRTLPNKFEEVKKHIIKLMKRNSHHVIMQKDIELERLKQQIESKQKNMNELEVEIEKMKQQKISIIEKNEKNSKKSLSKNNSLNINKSDNSIKEKEKVKIEHFMEKVEEQQKTIANLRRSYDEKQTQMTHKLMHLQAQMTKKDLGLKQLKQKLERQEAGNKKRKNEAENIRYEEEITMNKKIQTLQEQKQGLKERLRANQLMVMQKNKQIEQYSKKLNIQQQKLRKYSQKWKKKQQEYHTIISLKQKSINELIDKNKTVNIENKLLNEKVSLLQFNHLENSSKDSSQALSQLKQNYFKLQNKEKQLSLELQNKIHQISQLNDTNQTLKQKLANRSQKYSENDRKISQMTVLVKQKQLKIKIIQNQLEAVKKSNEHFKNSLGKDKSSQSFSKIKEEYERKIKGVKSQYQHRMEQYKKIKKQYESKIIKLSSQLEKALQANKESNIRQQFDENAERVNQLSLQLFKEREQHRKNVSKLQQQILAFKALSQVKGRQQIKDNLNNGSSIKHLNIASIGNNNNNPQFKGTDSFQLVHTGTMTENPERRETAINTIDLFEAELRCQHEPEPLIINNILDDDYLAFRDDEDIENMPQILIQADEEIEEAQKEKKLEQMKSSQLVKNLNQQPPEDEDVFQICDEEEEVNFGESSANLQIRQIFSHIRQAIEKLFNEEEIQMSILKVLPLSLQDDFFQLTTYVKQKIGEIRVQNEISFIMAEPGNGPQSLDDNSLQLPELIDRRGSQGNLKKLIEQKQALINSLMNEKVSQQNTINQLTMQKQEIEEENQNKFMNQCNIYKKQIKQHKKQIDVFEMNFQSLVNIVKNIMEIYSDPEDQQDDFRDNMTMLARIGKLNEKDRSRINYHIHRYLEIKKIHH